MIHITTISQVSSPEAAGRVRLQALVEYSNPVRPSEQYWFEVDEAYSESLSSTGNPWACAFAPLAVTLGEPLRINLPVDSLLLNGLHDVMQAWSAWYPAVHVVPIEADMLPVSDRESERRTAAFFSGRG